MEVEHDAAPAADVTVEVLQTRHGKQFPLHMNLFCRQKQYYGVASCLEFVHPFLTTAADDASGPQSPALPELDDDDAGQALLHEFYPKLTGVPATLNHEGPLAVAHIGALQSVTNAQLFSLFRSFRWAPPALRVEIAAAGPLFPEPSALMRVLWEPSGGVTERFAAARHAARADKPKYYRELSRDGYLCEPGLHAHRVFAPSLCTSTDNESATATSVQELYWHRLIDAYSLCLPDRSHIHELENLPQEIAIGELLAEVTGVAIPVPSSVAASPDVVARVDDLFPTAPSSMIDCVVDVGGGNAFLGVEVGERIGCDTMIIDPHYAPHSVDCCPRMWPDTPERVRPARPRRFAIHRKMAFFKDVDFRADIPAAPERCAFIAKHLCGTAVDECLRHLAAQNCWPRVLILVPCCFHKGQFDTYVNEPYLREVMHVDSQEAYTRMTKLTDWNRSIYQRAELDGDETGALAQNGTGDSRKRPRKSHHKAHTIDHLVRCQEAMAASVEALLNRGRMLWLQSHGYDVRLLEYVPDFVTPKNKCIVAFRRDAA